MNVFAEKQGLGTLERKKKTRFRYTRKREKSKV